MDDDFEMDEAELERMEEEMMAEQAAAKVAAAEAEAAAAAAPLRMRRTQAAVSELHQRVPPDRSAPTREWDRRVTAARERLREDQGCRRTAAPRCLGPACS